MEMNGRPNCDVNCNRKRKEFEMIYVEELAFPFRDLFAVTKPRYEIVKWIKQSSRAEGNVGNENNSDLIQL